MNKIIQYSRYYWYKDYYYR